MAKNRPLAVRRVKTRQERRLEVRRGAGPKTATEKRLERLRGVSPRRGD